MAEHQGLVWLYVLQVDEIGSEEGIGIGIEEGSIVKLVVWLDVQTV